MRRTISLFRIAATLCLVLGFGLVNAYTNTTASSGQGILAFPGADGWGRYTTGGRGGAVHFVTNLNDSGEGSLRSALEASGARTVIFRVSGTIELQSRIRISNGNLTIAGQTAPGDGICIKGHTVIINADNVIVRHMRFRKGAFVEADALEAQNQRNIIIDHCSMSWGVDEVASFYRNEYFTLQNCIISESFYSSIHSKGNHGYGGIWGGNKASFVSNLIAHHSSRTPRFHGARYTPIMADTTDFRNNVIYNWGFNGVHGGDPNEVDGTKARINIVNNYYKPGPGTNSGQVQYRILEPYAQASFGYSQFYVDGNYVDGYPNATNDNWGVGVQNLPSSQLANVKVDTPFPFVFENIRTAEDAYEYVLENAGATLPRRDSHDQRIVYETRTGTAMYGGVFRGANTGIIDSQDDVGGWPELFSTPPPLDSNGDGIPDEWWVEQGYDPLDPPDRNADIFGLGYTNLEYYINSIQPIDDFVSPPANLTAELTGVTVITLSWEALMGREEGFTLERKTNGEYQVIASLQGDVNSYVDSLLDEDTEYTYRVKAFIAEIESAYSNIASAQTLNYSSVPQVVTNPSPAHNDNDVKVSVTLQWESSVGAESYNVYFGESSPPAFVGNQTTTAFKPQVAPNTTYFWQVNAVNSSGVAESHVWSFTTRAATSSQLVGHWALDTYTALVDSSAFNHQGQLHNIFYYSVETEAPVGRAIRFNGTDQYASVPHSPEFDFEENDFTIAFWVNQNTDILQQSGIHPYIQKGTQLNDPSNNHFRRRYEVYSDPEASTTTFMIDDGQNVSSVSIPISRVVTGSWEHVVAVRNKSEGNLHLYVNGELIGVGNDLSSDISQYQDLYFAYRPDGDIFLRGMLDDIRLYNYAIEETELDRIAGITGVIERFTERSRLVIYPNPASARVMVAIPSAQLKQAALSIVDLTGRLVRTVELNASDLTYGQEVSIAGIPSGTYLLYVRTAERVFTTRLVVVQ